MKSGSENGVLHIHVSTTGCDQWSGLINEPDKERTDGPLASLTEARNRIRAARAEGRLQTPVHVLIQAGIYEWKETLVFSEEDLGCERTPVVYRAAGDGEVAISGGKALQKLRTDGEQEVYDFSEARSRGMFVRHVIRNGKRQQPARYPVVDPANPYDSGFLHVEGELADNYAEGLGYKDRFICRDPRLQKWSRIGEAELFVYPRHNWTNDIVRLKSYDPATGEVVLERPAAYEIYPGDRFYFRHVREELDSPGEWYYDSEEGHVYYKSVHDAEQSAITVPVIDQLIEVNGWQPPSENLHVEKIDWNDQGGPMNAHVWPESVKKGYIEFRDLTFDGCNGAGIVFRHVRGCKAAGCKIRNTGNVGAVIIGGAECEVRDCDIYDTGSHGVYASGGLRSPFNGLSVSCGHHIENNYIHHIGAFLKSSAGIAINGTGIRAANNLIHDGPRWGILSRGNDNILEYNHIRHVNIETSDTAAIYLVDRDLTMRGTKIRFNRIHDIPGYWNRKIWPNTMAYGIYLDDFTSGVEVYGNLTYRTPSGGMYIHGGHNILVENNMFLETEEEAAFFRRHSPEVELRNTGINGHSLRRNVFRLNILASTSAKAKVYKLDNCHEQGAFPDVEQNSWDHNLIWMYGKPLQITLLEGLQKIDLPFERWVAGGYDRSSIVADPMFLGVEKDDFRLRQDSVAYQLGFQRLPLEKMGLYPSEGRREWPVREEVGMREFPVAGTKSVCASPPMNAG